ncbi:Transcription elongation factor 1-like protein [Drosera capensis]
MIEILKDGKGTRTKLPPKKRANKLDTVFSCPFCNHGTSVNCRIDMKNLIGEAVCRICQERISTTVTSRFPQTYSYLHHR